MGIFRNHLKPSDSRGIFIFVRLWEFFKISFFSAGQNICDMVELCLLSCLVALREE
jgi:hypothetical protein